MPQPYPDQSQQGYATPQAAPFAGFDTIMMIFAFVAVFVGALIINNTFSITVAQRTKGMAMLRAISRVFSSSSALTTTTSPEVGSTDCSWR